MHPPSPPGGLNETIKPCLTAPRPPPPARNKNTHRLLLRNVFTEESDSGSYYPDVGTCTDPDAVVELQGECETIIEFDTVCDGSVTADGQADSPASTVVPTLSVLALAFVAAAASVW